MRRAVRAWWDALGFVCAVSLTLFVAASAPAAIVFEAHGRLRAAALAGALVVYLLLVPPLWAGICALIHRIYAHEEPSYADVWRGFARLYGQAVLLGAVQTLVSVVLAANVLYYGTRGSFLVLLLAVGFGYLLLFWLLTTVYQWPLLIAGDAGIIRRDDGGRPGLRSVLRNAFLLAFSAPAYTAVVLVVLGVVMVGLLITGVGMALLGGGFAAFLTTQATRDQLVRFGALPPPEEEQPLPEDAWRVK